MAETEYSLNLTNALTFTSGASANFTGVTVTGLSTGITTSPVVTFAANTASNSYLIVNGNPQTAASSPGGSNINLYTWYSPNTITIKQISLRSGCILCIAISHTTQWNHNLRHGIIGHSRYGNIIACVIFNSERYFSRVCTNGRFGTGLYHHIFLRIVIYLTRLLEPNNYISFVLPVPTDEASLIKLFKDQEPHGRVRLVHRSLASWA
jgi:hypothetical protein